MDDSPLVSTGDRFPLGLPGHAVPISSETPTRTARPWGMDQAVVPARIQSSGKHEKPTTTRQESQPTEYTEDSKVREDTVTQTVTD